jgi:hypothetical protein
LTVLHLSIRNISAKSCKFFIFRVCVGGGKHIIVFHVIPPFLIHKTRSTYMKAEMLYTFNVGIPAGKVDLDFRNRGKEI